MSMAKTLQQLKELTTEELIQLHDKQAQSTGVGLQYYLDELGRREQDKLNQEMLRLTQQMQRMTVIMMWATLIALIIAILSFLVSIGSILL